MSDYARRERRRLADLLLERGPDRPTLCTGWTTRDLAAHLVVRDRRPDAMAGMLVPPLAGHGEHVRKQKAAEAYDRIIAEVRNPPWWSPVSNPLIDEVTNLMEFFIHHEDVRRAEPGWSPRVLADDEQRALWKAVRLTGRIAMRRLKMAAVLRSPGLGEVTVGESPVATLTGEPGELAVFLLGRQRAARVDVDAPADIADRLRTAHLGT